MLSFKVWSWNLNEMVILCSMFSGLLTATVSSEVFRAAQPALLYLVPFTLLPLITMAYLKVSVKGYYCIPSTSFFGCVQLSVCLLICLCWQ